MIVAAYQALLRRTDLTGVYRLSPSDRNNVIQAAEINGYCVFPVNLRKVKHRDALLDSIAQALAFPEWFGHNYDALFDCLCDLGWRPAEGYLVLLSHCDGLQDNAREDLATVLNIFNQAAEEWRSQGIGFWCLVDTPDTSIDLLPTILGTE